ncbi:cytidine deaminase-like protein [Hyaloraphidium curvatum]|nr:cytidine deaminase-like protein [Hyaloraphidium curvatum]
MSLKKLSQVALDEPETLLLRTAIDAAHRLQIPGVQDVAACALTSSGQLFPAVGFESGGFASVCAEVAAMSCMVAAGRRDLAAIVAVWKAPDGGLHIVPPCGRCRELITDFNPQGWVIVSEDEDTWSHEAIIRPVKVWIGDLLPLRSYRKAV